MQVQQLIDSIVKLGFYKPYDDFPTYYFIHGFQGVWLDPESGEVGANLSENGDQVEYGFTYDLSDSDERAEAFKDICDYVHQILNPTVSQAISVNQSAKQWYDILETAAPGRFNIPTVL